MAVSKQGFKRLARKLLGSTFVEFSGSVTFINKGEFDYATQSTVDSQFEMPNCIVTSYTKQEVSNSENIQLGDKKLLLEVEGSGIIKSDDTECMINGVTYDIKMVDDIYGVIQKVSIRKK